MRTANTTAVWFGARPGALGLVLAFGLAACQSAPESHPYATRPVRELDAWSVTSADGRLLGRVTLLEIQDPRGAVRMYWAENQSRQWLGYADEQLRFYRRLPFVENESFVGMYPMEKGLALLYEEVGPVRVAPLRANRAGVDRAGVREASGAGR